ncbi:cation:proton antiporter [Desulfotalea psychrophila]|uniref:Cation:proton antiporter n=1 Tax=Desulfotalea psychrophila TaxID=84980 RepID=A0ABS3AXN0_9BACT|nr:cation:proton antiporter [Desulfocapsa sp.]MBN4063906.1 cation:proton antiporter [bacterium AH-315-I07]MBN4065037.1 cation:proton antiporter [Desulfocapsa sp. AH-315-G09]MBN4068095.1 cation:proton antiporter [Desulfotalea psychrophila]MBN4071693.1 cation:proton antiporter [Desulfotalea psychrophila]
MYTELAVLALFVFCYSLIAGRIERAAASGPIVFVVAGLFMGPLGLGWFDGDSTHVELRVLADLTLALVLFIDAANADFRVLKQQYRIPLRMLLLGLPGAIFLGTIAASFLFDSLSIYEAAILGTILAATDAALGKAVISNKAVPVQIREGLNIESGFNDGLCVPILFVFIAMAVGTSSEGSSSMLALTLVAEELGIGLAVGLGLAAIGTRLFKWCHNRGWVTDVWKQMTVVGLAIACFALAQSLHGSGYIAAFSGGLLFGYKSKQSTHKLILAAEGIGETMALMTWMLFGSIVIGQSIEYLTWEMLGYALLSLTVVRMLPIYLSLAGSGESTSAKLFLGWFGPRGLASIVFAIIVINKGVPQAKFVAMVVVLTVFLSLVAHGISANPLAKLFGDKTDAKKK